MSTPLILEIETLISRDPARRGLISSATEFGPLCNGHLARAASDLDQHARRVLIVTGFFIPRGEPPAAETDGPPGAVLLAAALTAIGIDVWIVTDSRCDSAVRATANAFGWPVDRVQSFDRLDAATASDFLREHHRAGLSHLIAIERVGPSHTRESVTESSSPLWGEGLGVRGAASDTTAPHPNPLPNGERELANFDRLCPPEHRNHCHNMRGEIIDEFAADLHLLFDESARSLPNVRTIGIGDGGNEIGMGAIPWAELARRLSGEQAGWIPCRIAADWNIVAGTSNWGAQALAASVLLLRGRTEVVAPWDEQHEVRVLEHVVAHGPAVDGVTRRCEPTVDGIPFLTYIQPWLGMRRLLGLDAS
ncbi:MAG: DUF4392 domain-containing protein [Planctomycetales bacterium]|nr:DUF4392 domain-containing protein [Planctomycetales bacterium]